VTKSLDIIPTLSNRPAFSQTLNELYRVFSVANSRVMVGRQSLSLFRHASIYEYTWVYIFIPTFSKLTLPFLLIVRASTSKVKVASTLLSKEWLTDRELPGSQQNVDLYQRTIWNVNRLIFWEKWNKAGLIENMGLRK
jgi:hypothetical protein